MTRKEHAAINEIVTLFFFNDTATTEIYTLSLHDALPIFLGVLAHAFSRFDQILWLAFKIAGVTFGSLLGVFLLGLLWQDRKSTRLNSSHGYISYAVFCLKKKNAELAFSAPVRHRV